MTVIRARLSGAEELAIGTHVLPSSATQTDSTAAGAGVLAGTVGLAWDAVAMLLAPADGPAPADAFADGLTPTEGLADELAPAEALADEPAPADAPELLVGVAVSVGLAVGEGLGNGLGDELAPAEVPAEAVGLPADAGAPQARKVPFTAATPSIATVVSSEKAVDFVQLLPSDDDQEAARPGAVSLVSVPTTTTWPLPPAMPRASKPSREVAALAQSRPDAEYQTDEPLVRVGPVPFHRPTMMKPPGQAVTALSV
jgi:hypothetical protein